MIKELDYETVYEFWQKYLWPNRAIIMPMSTMRYNDIAYKGILKNTSLRFLDI